MSEARLAGRYLPKSLIFYESLVPTPYISHATITYLAVNGAGEPKRSINNIRVQRKESLSNLVGTRVLRVERSDESSLLAVVVELVMDAALRENSALELVQVPGDLWVLARLDKCVLEHETELEVGAFDEREEFGGAGVHVGSVDAAGVEEAEGGADSQAGEDGEVGDILEEGC
jgi:hypothetical protein